MVTEQPKPHAKQSQSQRVTQQPTQSRSDNGDADHRRKRGILRIARASQATEENDLRDLEVNNNAQHAHNHHTHIENFLLIRKQAIEIPAKEQEDHRHHKRAEKSNPLAHGGVQLCKVAPLFAEAPADQRHRRHRKPIAERERQTHHIHANLVRSIRSGAEVRNGDGEQQKTDAQEDLLHKRAGTDVKQ